MNKVILLFFLLLNTFIFAQVVKINDQTRYNSDSRQFYVWSEEKQAYDLRETEFENSIIDIREILSHANGYIVISLNDDGNVRLYHGSILSFDKDENGNSVWVMRSKNARGKLMFDPKARTMTYSYEATEKRYAKIFVFTLVPDMLVKDE